MPTLTVRLARHAPNATEARERRYRDKPTHRSEPEMTASIDIDLQSRLTTQWDEKTTFPFAEDEDANITGYGHQDKAEFADAVNAYDTVCNDGEPYEELDQWTADNVSHRWALTTPDGERLYPVSEGTPGAFPITTLWGQR